MKPTLHLACIFTLVTIWTLGCPTPPEPSTGHPPPPANPTGPSQPDASGSPAGPGPGTPPGGEGSQPPVGAGQPGSPPPGQTPPNPFEEPTGPLPSFADLIEGGKTITLTVTLQNLPADARGQIDIMTLEDGQPKLQHVEKFSGAGPFKITAPASLEGTVMVSSHLYGDSQLMSRTQNVTFGGKDVAVTVPLEPPEGGTPEVADPVALTPETPPEGSAPAPAGNTPAPEGNAPAPGGNAPAPGTP